MSIDQREKATAGRASLSCALLLATSLAVGCSKKKEDTLVVSGPPGDSTPEEVVKTAWIPITYLTPENTALTIAAAVFADGGPREPIPITFSRSGVPVSLFQTGLPEFPGIAPAPFLALAVETGSRITARHVKSLAGQNVSSKVVLPVSCPSYFTPKVEPGMQLVCLPLINAVLPDFLVATDSGGAYVHDLIFSVKKEGKSAALIQTRVATRIVVPNSQILVDASPELKKIGLSERLTMVTNDLLGSPRRDFPAFEVTTKIAPGVQTDWVLDFSNVKMTIEEEVFYEQPVMPGSTKTRPVVSRGGGFYKRRTAVNSLDHFRVRVYDAYDPTAARNLGPLQTSVRFPILDGNAPLRIFIGPDFDSDSATRSMTEYVRPYGPNFCPKEQAAFKPEEWRKGRESPSYVACEASKRTRIVDLADAIRQGVTNPTETFFGSFSYMPRLGDKILAGTNGVLSLRLTITGDVVVSVRDLQAPEKTIEVGRSTLAYTYQLPTAIEEMRELIRVGKGTPGMDTILASIERKGIQERPAKTDGTVFTFMGAKTPSFFH